ncbi:MAG: sulfatase-like hydrolase/transferase, partial [Gammaproteobacteria bacterium]|nr:sulfatase-like hydrolase/transferase [Gammaproteobacteria bacterium]
MNLLILVADALRYDYFRFLDLQLPLVEFDNAFAVSLASEPNFTSLLTGLTPDEHGVYANGVIDYDGPTLFTEMKKLDYHTISMLGYYSLYRKGADKALNIGCDATAGPLLQQAYDWIDEEPWCAMVRLMDTHNPYAVADRRAWKNRGDYHINPAVLREAYKKAVVYLGQSLNTFLEKLLKKYPETVVVITADHGEELLQHGKTKENMEHHFGLWDTLVHVPLAIYYPEWNWSEAIAVMTGLRQHNDLYHDLGRMFRFSEK